MKKMTLFVLARMLAFATLSAQIHLFLEEQEVILEDGKATGWVFPAAGTQDEVLEDMKEYLKDRSDLKLKKGGDNTLIAEKVSLPAVTTLRGDLIGTCIITEQYYSVAVVFKLGYDISLNSKDWQKEMESLRNYVKAFMAFHYEAVYARRIKDLEKELNDVEKDRKQTESKMASMTNKMNNLSKKIGNETETEKINSLQAEINTIEADLKALMDTLPGLDEQIAGLNKRLDQNRKESNAYLSTINGF